jgi:hypothetical protein
MDGPRVLRPLGYAEIFNESFDLYKRNFALFTGIGAIVYIPYALLFILLGGSQAGQNLVQVLFWIPSSVCYIAIVKALADRYLNREATINGCYAFAWRRVLPFFLTMLLAGLLFLGGLVLLVVPGILIAIFWFTFFIWNVPVVEGRYYADAIRRCRELAAGQYGRILVMFILMGIVFGIAYLILIAILVPLLLLAGAGSGPGAATSMTMRLFLGFYTGLIGVFLTPIVALPELLFYFDTRVRKEGYDVELLAQEMAGER